MSVAADTTHSEALLSVEMEKREQIQRKWEALSNDIAERKDSTPTEADEEQFRVYREELVELDTRIDQRSKDIEATRTAIENATRIRRVLAGSHDGVDSDDEGIMYRDFASYALDYIVTRSGPECSKIAQLAGGEKAVNAARERLNLLKRTPADTLSGNVGGLQPPQFIDQIFQVINKTRPLVNAAPSTSLVRGQLTYPKIATRPVVAVQGTEKTEAGNQGMVVDMETTNASTYLGGGDLSWQAINWSTPDALQLWFDLAAADYALKTETDAANVVIDDAFVNVVSNVATMNSSDFEALMKAVGEGYAKVYAQSGRIANTVVVAPDFYGYMLGLTSTPMPIFISVNGQNIGPLNLLVSRGLDSGTALVGDMAGLLVAETAGAPVELRVVEPAIGGVEVGIIGAFEAVIVDAGSFSLISAAS